MTDREKLIVDFFKRWEGSYVNHPADKGGPTNMGVTIGTFKQFFGMDKTVEDLKNMTDEQWMHIFKEGFWIPVKVDQIEDDYTALIVLDMCWNSGVKNAIRHIQKVVGAKQDGIVGPVTLYKLNNFPDVFQKIWDMRKQYYIDLVDLNYKYDVFLKGWLNRLNDIKRLKEEQK